jgi:hypothetical protein
MRLLLDTHAFIWGDSEPDRLPSLVREYCLDRGNIVLLSVASGLEIVTVHGKDSVFGVQCSGKMPPDPGLPVTPFQVLWPSWSEVAFPNEWAVRKPRQKLLRIWRPENAEQRNPNTETCERMRTNSGHRTPACS